MSKLRYLLFIYIVFIMFCNSVSASTTGVITADIGLKVRDKVNGSKITTLAYGTSVTVTSTEEGATAGVCDAWYKIEYGSDNKVGYACGDYIELLKGYASCSSKDTSVNIWSNVNMNSTVTSVSCDVELTILDKDIASNSYCSNNWYKVSYNDTVGYVCSSYVYTRALEDNENTVDTSYYRPWTTPKKAILGGAVFVSSSYISQGQFTSYLKKFNVNPNSSYSLYNHQYMANLAAPSSEAKSSYNSYLENGLLDLPLNFVIPVFENMPDYTVLPGNDANTNGQSEVTDTAFETLLDAEGFPESYKSKLRLLHNTYPNWTFKALNTGLDFTKSVKAEQTVCSISGNKAYYYVDADGNYVSTESGWYLANTETVAYYLDPRNFLTAIGILQFESLKNSTNYTETVVQSVLKNTFMKGNSDCDKQSYASIFVEAGVSADVSPVYLASLARQESGVNGSMATTGEKFSYKGITYKWLYNFFNIGAYSSEESPIRAGLVYASGGDTSVITTSDDTDTNVCPVVGSGNSNSSSDNSSDNSGDNSSDDVVVTTPVVTNKGANYYVSKLSAKVSGNYLNGISLGTTVGTVTSKLGDAKSVSVVDSSGKALASNSKVKTGDVVKITDLDGTTKYSYTIVLYGDVNGDGKITASDYVVIKNYILGKKTLSGAYGKAADTNKSNSITASDYVVIKNYILGKSSISQI